MIINIHNCAGQSLHYSMNLQGNFSPQIPEGPIPKVFKKFGFNPIHV